MSPSSDLPLRILMVRADGPGGVARTVLNLASHLASHRPVELVSVRRTANEPTYPLDPRVVLTHLTDSRPIGPKGRRNGDRRRYAPEAAARPEVVEQLRLEALPSVLVPDDESLDASTDPALLAWVRGLEPCLVVAARPSLSAVVARHAPPGVLVIGQEHSTLQTRRSTGLLLDETLEALAGCAAYVCLTDDDVAEARALAPDVRTPVVTIPNGLPITTAAEPAALEEPVVVAAGRLDAVKGFDRLVDAWLPLRDSHPGWSLHLYGKGPLRAELDAQVARLGLGDVVVLEGFSTDFPDRLRQASVYAMSSHNEGFPMVLLEAASLGVPVVSFDCPYGPRAIVHDGVDGRLVPEGDVPALSAALAGLMDDADLRRRLGRAAWEGSREYAMDRMVARWEELFDLVAADAGPAD